MTVELPHSGKEIICAVAQVPHQKDESFFCTLRPVLFADSCHPAPDAEFPDRGMVWWWWTNGATESSLAHVGKLVSVVVEPARKQSFGTNHYQARKGSAKELHEAGFYELIRAESVSFKSESDITSKAFYLGHVPSSIVFVLWNNTILGPFRTTIAEALTQSSSWKISLVPQQKDNRVNRIPKDKSEAFRKLGWQSLTFEYSLTDRVTGSSNLSHKSSCVILKKDQLDEDMLHAESFLLETDSELIRRVAKTALSMSRKEKQELKNVLEQMESRLSQADSPECPSALKAIDRIREIQHVEDDIAKEAAESLLICGALTEKINQRIEEKASAEEIKIRAKAEEKCGDLRIQLDKLEKDRDEKAAELEQMALEFKTTAAKQTEELKKREQEINEKEAAFLEVLLPVTEELKSGSNAILQQAIKLKWLFPGLESPSASAPSVELASSPERTAVVRTGVSYSSQSEFVQNRLYPILREWLPGVALAEAQNLFASVLGSRCVLLPEIYPVSAVAEAVGTALELYHVEPDWLSFRPLWENGLRKTWQDACNHPEQMFIVAVSGINRAPSGAWAQPILTHSAAISGRMPDLGQTKWPMNMRIAFIWDSPSDVTFDLDRTFRFACSAWKAGGISDNEPGITAASGFVSGSIWTEWVETAEANGAALTLESDDNDYSPTWRRGTILDFQRIAGTMISLGREEPAAVRVAKFLRIDAPLEAARPNEQ